MRRSTPFSPRRLRAAFLAPLAVAALAAFGAPRAGHAQALPDATTLMEKHNAAIGGRAMLDKHSSIRMTATMSIASMGIEGQMEVIRAKPNKFVQKITLGPVGEIFQGYDGKVGWSTNPMTGAQLSTGDELVSAKNNADFFANFQDPAAYTNPQTVELTQFEGKLCYKVKLTRDGRDGFEYFDSVTGLLAGLSGAQPTPQGPMEVTTVFVEYVDVEGLKLPKRIEQRGGPASATIVFTAFEFDKVDAAAFDLPPAVKALVKP